MTKAWISFGHWGLATWLSKWELRRVNPLYLEVQSMHLCHVLIVQWHWYRRMGILNSTLKVWLLPFQPSAHPQAMHFLVKFLQHCQGLSQGGKKVKKNCLSFQQTGASNYDCQMRPRLRSRRRDAILLCLVTASPHVEFIMNYHCLLKTPINTL